jgi:hypothetical protein
VKIAETYEIFFGKYADHHLTVSQAFKKDLIKKLGVNSHKISVLYDRAVEGKFKPLDEREKAKFLYEKMDVTADY